MPPTYLPEPLIQALDAKEKVDVRLMGLWHRILVGEVGYSETELRENVESCHRAMQAVRALLSATPTIADGELHAGQGS